MTTHFITAEFDLEATSPDIQTSIEAKLREQGEPLRWAVTDIKAKTATVEAVILNTEDTVPSR